MIDDLGMEEKMSLRSHRRPSSLWFVVAGCAILVVVVVALGSGASSRAASSPVAVFPIAGGHVAAPRTQITFRGVPVSQLGPVAVTGSVSGPHTGSVLADSDGMGGSFIPAKPFTPGEVVTVKTGLDIVGGTAGSFSFTIATPAGRIRASSSVLPPAPRVTGDLLRFASRRDLAPAAVRVTRLPHHAAPGDLFVTPQQGPIENGPMIVGPYGGLIWFKPVPRFQIASDFRVQTYEGRPVLTWWQGYVSGAGTGQAGEGEILSNAYAPVATVKAGNGLSSDLHEFQLTPQNTALITAYYPVYWNTSSVRKGSKRAIVLDSVIQEIDIPTGLVLFQWDSLDHVPVAASYGPPPKLGAHPYDYFHVNSIQQAADGNFIVSGRNTWAVYKISDQTGAVIWTLNGKHSSFKMGRGTSFALQHDARLLPNNLITLFDDGAGLPIVHSQSRGLVLRLDTAHMTATLVGQDVHRPAVLAFFEGSVQSQSGGDNFVGWGQVPYFTEFNARGRTVFDARFVGANSSYRAFRFPWSATPAAPPAVAASRRGARTTVYASWNGATTIARWRVVAGAAPATLTAVASAPRRGFETAIRIPPGERYVAAQAIDAQGHVLSTSNAVKVP